MQGNAEMDRIIPIHGLGLENSGAEVFRDLS